MHAHNFNNFQIRELTVSPCNFYRYVEKIKIFKHFDIAPPVKVRQRPLPSAAADTIGRTKLPSSVCSSVTYGAWEPSSPDSLGGGGREDPLAHRPSKYHCLEISESQIPNSQLKYSQPTSISDAHVLSWSILNISNNSWPI